MVPNSNSTVLPSGIKVTRTSFSGGMFAVTASLINRTSSALTRLRANLRTRKWRGAPLTRSLFEFRCRHRVWRGDVIAQLFPGGFHGLAANCIGDSCVHHQFGQPARSLVERNRGLADRVQIVAGLCGGQLLMRLVDGQLLVAAQLRPCGVCARLLDLREYRIGLNACFN